MECDGSTPKNGDPVYEFEDAIVDTFGVFTNTKVEVPCMSTYVVNSVDIDTELMEHTAEALLREMNTITGAK